MLRRFIARRLAYAVVTVLLASLLVFVALQLLPGNLATQILGNNATPNAVAQLDRRLHLNTPAWKRYLEWLSNALHGNFGHSLVNNQSVLDEAARAMRNTGMLALLVVVVGVTLSVALGLLAGLYRDKVPDLLISTVSLLGFSLPEFTIATVLVLVFSIKLGWLPAVVTAGPTASVGQLLQIIWLPAASLAIVMSAYIVRMARTSVIDVLGSEYVMMARLRGLSPLRVVLRHALPNALLPTLNVIALNVAWLFGGVVVVESIFNYPGIGTLMVQAVHDRDLPVLQFIAVLGALVFVMCNLAADLASIWLNPRLRTAERRRR